MKTKHTPRSLSTDKAVHTWSTFILMETRYWQKAAGVENVIPDLGDGWSDSTGIWRGGKIDKSFKPR